MRHLLQLMTNQPMLITVPAHQSAYASLMAYYQNPKAFFRDAEDQPEKKETFCHLSVFGPTTHRFNGLDANCRAVRCYRDVRQELLALASNDKVPRIFIEFCGPGGESDGCFDLSDTIAEIAKDKPVIGFINGHSYSANYALASACSELYATPYSLGGSIGVILGREERTEEGRKITYFTSGEAKADGQPHHELNEAESQRLQTLVDSLADQFATVVAANRNITAEQVKALQANVFTAQQLDELGLIDGIKTEEEMKLMMITTSTHKKAMAELESKHQTALQAQQQEHETELGAALTSNKDLLLQITQLQQQATEQAVQHKQTLLAVNQLAAAHGVADKTAEIVASGATLDEAKEAIKKEAAHRDEDITLTHNVDEGESQKFDMQQLIKDA
ncbi:capsid assembly protease C [Vibrio phage vB_Va_Val-yong3]|nr:capsid assembly protease C [Vibrio phage vB_Va_Val-yong3]